MTDAMPMPPAFLDRENTWTGTAPSDEFVKNYQFTQLVENAKTTPDDMLGRLVQLLEEDGEDEFGAMGPSRHAFATSFKLIRTAENYLPLRVLGAPAVDSTGGVRVTWKRSDRQLRLVCPSTRAEGTYVYLQSATENKVFREITPNSLADHWMWLVSGGDIL